MKPIYVIFMSELKYFHTVLHEISIVRIILSFGIWKEIQIGISCCFSGGPNIWAITSEERMKYDKQFDSLKPIGGYVTGWCVGLQ